MDIVAELGELALASRLKRLSEKLLKDAAALYQDLDIRFHPRWFPAFHALALHEPLSASDLAQALGLSHPAISQVVGQMCKAGLIRQAKDRSDDRRRLLSLTTRGRLARRKLEPVWAQIRAAAREVLEESGVDLLRDLDRIESTMGSRSIADRARARLGLPPQGALRIVDYRPAYKKHFRALNAAWLSTYFQMEPEDHRILDDPNRQIIRRGGHILFALLDNGVVGTCALLRHSNGLYELCKMAVDPSARRRGIGTALAGEVLRRARGAGADRIYLQTSPVLADAVRLYQRLGFRRIARNPLPQPAYARCSITMSLNLARVPAHNRQEVKP